MNFLERGIEYFENSEGDDFKGDKQFRGFIISIYMEFIIFRMRFIIFFLK